MCSVSHMASRGPLFQKLPWACVPWAVCRRSRPCWSRLGLLHRFLTAEVSRVGEVCRLPSAVRKPEKRPLETFLGLLCCIDLAWAWSLRPRSPSTPALSEASLCWKMGLLMGTAL